MTTCTNVLFPKQIFQKRTKAYMGIHVTNSCMYSKEVLKRFSLLRSYTFHRHDFNPIETNMLSLFKRLTVQSTIQTSMEIGPVSPSKRYCGETNLDCGLQTFRQSNYSTYLLCSLNAQIMDNAYIGVVTSLAGVFNFESLCLSNDACAYIVFNF